MRVCHIDGDGFLYKSAYAGEWKNPFAPEGDDTIYTDFDLASQVLRNLIGRAQERTNADRVAVALGSWTPGAKCFRHDILPSYKSRRVGAKRPELYEPLRKLIEKEYCWYSEPELEGEDLVGLLVTLDKGRNTMCEWVASSFDKDMLTVPCALYNPELDSEGVREITKDEAHRYHMLQTLMGDSIDGYTGIPGIGPKKAEYILKGLPAEKLWDAVVTAYEQHDLSEEDALTQARMAFVLRMPYYDFKTHELTGLWGP